MARAGPARSRRPPRETMTAIGASLAASATSAGAGAEIADRQIAGLGVLSDPRRLRSAAVARATRYRKHCDGRASPAVKRSNRNVARPSLRKACATKLLRGLSRPLPLPWAKITSPVALRGMPNKPWRRCGPMSISIVSGTIVMHCTPVSHLAGDPTEETHLTDTPFRSGTPAERVGNFCGPPSGDIGTNASPLPAQLLILTHATQSPGDRKG